MHPGQSPTCLAISSNQPPLRTVNHTLLPVLPHVVTVLAEIYRVQLAVIFNHHCRDVVVLEAFLSALPVTREFGFMPISRVAHCTGNETQLFRRKTCKIVTSSHWPDSFTSFCWHDSYSCVSAAPFRTTAFLFFCDSTSTAD